MSVLGVRREKAALSSGCKSRAWARRAVGAGVKSCPRAGCGKSACPDRAVLRPRCVLEAILGLGLAPIDLAEKGEPTVRTGRERDRRSSLRNVKRTKVSLGLPNTPFPAELWPPQYGTKEAWLGKYCGANFARSGATARNAPNCDGCHGWPLPGRARSYE